MSLLTILHDDYSEKTSVELEAWCDANPIGCVVAQKTRQRVIAEKLATEKQAVADTFLNIKDYPKSEAGFGSDACGEHVKIYLTGKAVLNDG